MNFFEKINFLESANVGDHLILVFASILIGLIIGAEREYQNKSAGLRTFILVSFGSCLFTILSIDIGVQNPDRLAANIITGIGFLGAGVIFKDDNKIGGITTATTIWATASLGMAVGSGHLYLGFLGTFLVMIILRLLVYLQNFIDNYNKIRDYRINTNSLENFEYCKKLFDDCNLKYSMIKQQYSQELISTTWRIRGKTEQHQILVAKMIQNDRINAFQY
ncbi:MgtC/SapB family protein [Soonwooa sp.]|uniref:MgtC/SapB family protein n=1 Tax=Soonwooa sp. TaxID=1938592 RepID=UPI00263964A2|nr:MgtC/SapB family protein [Soonwooa sp.]